MRKWRAPQHRRVETRRQCLESDGKKAKSERNKYSRFIWTAEFSLHTSTILKARNGRSSVRWVPARGRSNYIFSGRSKSEQSNEIAQQRKIKVMAERRAAQKYDFRFRNDVWNDSIDHNLYFLLLVDRLQWMPNILCCRMCETYSLSEMLGMRCEHSFFGRRSIFPLTAVNFICVCFDVLCKSGIYLVGLCDRLRRA